MSVTTTRIPLRMLCKHDNGFSCVCWREGKPDQKYVFVCNISGCGYFLNFDPDRFPHGISILDVPKAHKPTPRVKDYSKKW